MLETPSPHTVNPAWSSATPCEYRLEQSLLSVADLFDYRRSWTGRRFSLENGELVSIEPGTAQYETAEYGEVVLDYAKGKSLYLQRLILIYVRNCDPTADVERAQ